MRKKVWRGQTYRQNSQPASPKFWRMKKNQSFKIPLNASRENIEIISDFKNIHDSKSSSASKSQFHFRRTGIEQKHRIARIWSFSLNNKWLENVGQQLACPKVVHARKAKATYMLPMGYVDRIGKYMNMKGWAEIVFLPIFLCLQQILCIKFWIWQAQELKPLMQ